MQCDHAARRLLRAAQQNAILITLASAAVWGGLAYGKLQIELWLAEGFLLAVALVNLIRVMRTNRASASTRRD
jgi:hypothetical protein